MSQRRAFGPALGGFILACTVLCSVVPTEAPAQCEQAKLTAGKGTEGDRFGIAVSVDGNLAVVGAYLDDERGTASGSAYVFEQTRGRWIRRAKLTAGDAGDQDWFGSSVAVSGNYVVVGAFRDDDAGTQSGSAYVFRRTGMSWEEQAKLTASDAAAHDLFGYSVSISGDYILVGAYLDDDAGSASGSVYVFKRAGLSWVEQGKLTARDAQPFAYFGCSVSLDGDYAAVGAFGHDDRGGDLFDESGAVYVFRRLGGDWIELARLTAGDPGSGDRLGYSVSLSGDDLLAGAYLNSDAGTFAGSAYAFRRAGLRWIEQDKLIASDASAGDEFGFSVSLSENRAVVGSWFDDEGGSGSGSAYIFEREFMGWTEQGKLTASDASPNDLFGVSVASGDHHALVAAMLDDDTGDASGSVYVYQLAPGSGDFDGDSDVDLVDFGGLQDCFTDADPTSFHSGCCAFDFEPDGDVDLEDFRAFQEAFSGTIGEDN